MEKLELHEYQKEGIAFLAGKTHALLAHEMGLGKSAMAIHGLLSVHAKSVLIVCPMVARINWQREIEMWSELKSAIMVKLTDEPRENAINICSFDYATHNYEALNKIAWDCLIIDEAHFLKSNDAKRTKAIMGVQGIIRASKRCWLMTGTPAPNHPGELWIMLYTFGVTKLKYDDFINYFCVVRQTTYGLKIVSAQESKIPELKQLLSKIMLRRLKKDVMKELPPITYGLLNVEPGPVDVEILPSFCEYFIPTNKRKELFEEIERQHTLLKTVEENLDYSYDDKAVAFSAISKSVSTLRRYVGLQKCEGAIEVIKNELETKAINKIVIFAIHRDVIETMRIGLRKFGVVCVYGGTDPDKRQRHIDRFQNNKFCRVFIGNIQAAGTAVTLTAAHHVTFVEQSWVPGENAQAIMRCHRIGQENPVTVRFILLDQSLDARIGWVLKKKTKDLTMIFD